MKKRTSQTQLKDLFSPTSLYTHNHKVTQTLNKPFSKTQHTKTKKKKDNKAMGRPLKHYYEQGQTLHFSGKKKNFLFPFLSFSLCVSLTLHPRTNTTQNLSTKTNDLREHEKNWEEYLQPGTTNTTDRY